MKFLILIVFSAILISLGSAVFSLTRGKPSSRWLVKSFTVRIVLSVLLLILIFVAYYTGALQPNILLPYNQ